MKVVIVICGGLCLGLNDVIRAVVFILDVYGVVDIFGICYGYRGFFVESFTDIFLIKYVV